jgi:hypothetical protein
VQLFRGGSCGVLPRVLAKMREKNVVFWWSIAPTSDGRDGFERSDGDRYDARDSRRGSAPNQFDHILADARNKPVVRGVATSLVNQRSAATIAITLPAADASASCSTPESPRPKSHYVALPELRKKPLCVAVRVRSSSPNPISASRTSSSEG